MKKLTLILSLLILAFLPAQAVKKVEANPINIAVMLTEQVDSAAIASTLDYYGYQPQPTQSPHTERSSNTAKAETSYSTYSHPNGSIIRYTFTTAEDGKAYPTIEVKSKGTQKDKDQLLQDLNFQKNGNAYDRRSIGHQTRCTSATGGFLRFTNHPKPKAQ